MSKKKYKSEMTMIKQNVARPMQEAVGIPLAWAVIMSSVLGLVATLAVAGLRSVAGATWPWWAAPGAGGVIGLVILAWRICIAEGDRRALLLWPLEGMTGVDIDQDGIVGEPNLSPSPRAEPRIIYVSDPYHQRQQQDAKDFRYFLREAYGARGTTWRAWSGQRLPSGRQVTRPTWERWTERLLRGGCAARTYPTAPLELVTDYRTALGALRELL